MKIEEILDYKLTKLLKDKAKDVTDKDRSYILNQSKSKIQAYCHINNIPESIYYIWCDIAIEVLKQVDSSLFNKDIMSDEELAKRVNNIKVGDTNIAISSANENNSKINTGNNIDDILLSFSKQLQNFRKISSGCGDVTNGI